jgi:glycine cleavage system H protein
VIIEGYAFPDELLYDKRHFWSRVDGDILTMGLTDYAIKAAGDLVYVEVISPGKKVVQDKPFMSVESGKWVGRVHAPVSGTVVEVNEELEFEPAMVNRDPYGAGWLVKIKIDAPGELDSLLKESSFSDWFIPELRRLQKLQQKKSSE